MPKYVSLKINDKSPFNVLTNVSLLSILNENKIFLPSVCGGRGLCGKCKCKVLQGGNPIQPAEFKRLSKEDIQNQFRLACQVNIDNDIHVEIPDSLLNSTEFEAQIASIRQLTHDIKLVSIDLIEPDQIHFKAGQFIQLKCNPYEQIRQTAMRSYSIASPSWSTQKIDILVRLVKEGFCSTWVHQYLKEGDKINFVGPRGDFFLHEGNEDIILVAGGSGMAPMVSILHELSVNGSKRQVVYFFGACKYKDLYYLDEMNDFKKKIMNFRFIPVLSEPENSIVCEIETGLVTKPFEAFLEKNDTSTKHIYLCGSPPMIQNCKVIAIQHGISENNIFYDSFA